MLRRVGLAVFVFAAVAGAALGQIPGSIRTVDETAAAQDLFSDRGDVFLAAGSPDSPCRSVEQLADGAYYFQVTTATGDELLSSDPVSERRITVKNGVFFSYDGTTHTKVVAKTGCNSLAVGLAPFDDAGTRKAAYLVWITPVARFAGISTDVGPVCGDGCFFGFRPESSTTRAFRVEDKRNCEPTFCVAGTIYSDANGDGIRQTGEAGQTDVAVRVAGPSGALLSGYSGTGGAYKICGLTSSDTFLVHEAVPNGFKQTGPKDKRISKALIAKDLGYIVQVCCVGFSGLDFGNQLIPGSIGGLVYEDLNASGARDAGEPPLPGAVVTLTPTDPAGTAQTATSGADGTFLFQKLAAGTYSLTQTAPAGFTQTQPATDGYEITLASGASSLNNNFGDFKGVLLGSLAGVVFNDLNGNGIRDAGEPGMAGVTVRRTPPFYPLCLIPPDLCGETVTDAEGRFKYENVAFGTYSLAETVPTGYKQTAPPPPGTITATVDFAHQNITGLLFGNQILGVRIFGLVFVDTDGNGAQNGGEGPQSGVTVRLTPSIGSTVTRVTGADGTFSFDGLSAGTFTLSEVVPTGYLQTAPPPPGTFSITAVAGDTKGPYLFGNQLAPALGSISGDKWLDFDQNGVVNGVDYPLAGITFVLTDSHSVQRFTVSDANGLFSFTGLPTDTYDLREILPPNFFQTFPGTPFAPLGYTITLAPGEAKTGYRFLNKC